MLLAALHTWAVECADQSTAEARKAAAAAATKLITSLEAQDLEAYRALQDAAASLIAGLNNDLFASTETAVRGRVKFHAAAA